MIDSTAQMVKKQATRVMMAPTALLVEIAEIEVIQPLEPGVKGYYFIHFNVRTFLIPHDHVYSMNIFKYVKPHRMLFIHATCAFAEC